ncbi:MAG: tRNA lysidine(34) synthetase TilS [Parvularculaceae bacterium]
MGEPRSILIALSGGSDSLALLHLAAPLRRCGVRVGAATIDHGLREASRAEAEQVAAMASALGVEHDILCWTGEKPKTGIQAAAREARYALLAGHAVKIGAGAIMTGHTADDQAETLLMRVARGGAAGLSGMRQETMIASGPLGPVRLLRPLLDRRRAALQAFLRNEGVAWIDDPSNDDRRFERVRLRAEIAQKEAVDPSFVSGLVSSARLEQERADDLDQRILELFAEAGGAFADDGTALLQNFSAIDEDCAPALLARLGRAVSGAQYSPSAGAAKTLFNMLGEQGGKRPLGGALFERCGGALSVRREPAAVFGRAGVRPMKTRTVAAGESLLWDGRFIIRNTSGCAVELAPLGPNINGLDPTGPALRYPDGETAHVGAPDGGDPMFVSLAPERFFERINRFNSPYEFVKSACGAGLP